MREKIEELLYQRLIKLEYFLQSAKNVKATLYWMGRIDEVKRIRSEWRKL